MQDKITLSSAEIAERIAFLRERQGVTLETMGEGKASTAQSWESGKMPRKNRWRGISERLGLSESMIFFGRPTIAEDYAFIAKWRNEIADSSILLAPHGSASPATVHEDPAHYGTSEAITAEIRAHIERVILAAASDPRKLGWIIQQLQAHVEKPPHWKGRSTGLVELRQDPAISEQQVPNPLRGARPA